MYETRKNYKMRIENGDFLNYLHGFGIDIGGGPDCLVLPKDVDGKVRLWDIQDGDAQYKHSIKDETFDFVYSSHCLEHMRNVRLAFMNWLRICKVGGYLYICVPHEHYYEKDIWPSVNNSDHRWSFTKEKKTKLPKNIAVYSFLKKFCRYVDIVDIRENLSNYNFYCDQKIDQTLKFGDGVCAQIDFIVRKKRKMKYGIKKRIYNEINWALDTIVIINPLRIKIKIMRLVPENIKSMVKQKINRGK